LQTRERVSRPLRGRDAEIGEAWLLAYADAIPMKTSAVKVIERAAQV
jgi:hypothetical protein